MVIYFLFRWFLFNNRQELNNLVVVLGKKVVPARVRPGEKKIIEFPSDNSYIQTKTTTAVYGKRIIPITGIFILFYGTCNRKQQNRYEKKTSHSNHLYGEKMQTKFVLTLLFTVFNFQHSDVVSQYYNKKIFVSITEKKPKLPWRANFW